jgi:hypothetical protein
MKLRQSFVYALVLAALLVVMWYLATFLVLTFHLSRDVAGLGSMVLLYLAVSFLLKRLQRRHEESELTQLAAAQGLNSESVNELRATRERSSAKVETAIRIGILWVNFPILPIMFGPLALAQYGFAAKSGWVSGATLAFGFVAAWVWWSVNVSMWRRWAVRRGVDAWTLQQRAVEATLVWPQGHFLERTELDRVQLWWNASRRAAGKRRRG